MVITTHHELIQLTTRIREETAYVYPVVADAFRHPASNTLSSFHFLFDDGAFYTVSVTHPDAPQFSLDLGQSYKLITLYQKELRHLTNAVNIIDFATILHLLYEELPTYREYYTTMIQHIKNQFRMKNLHYSIPLTSWADSAERFLQHCRTLYQQHTEIETGPAFQFINQVTIPTLTTIESAGLHTTDGMVYSDYNIYTSTGRPSNAFGGINFAALNKHDGTREKFTSRFGENGTLVQFDYEAFHLRLAANRIGYQLPPTSVHTFLAKQYYGTDDITDEMYEASKARTFALMYGQTDDTGNVELFQKIKEYASTLWHTYGQQGYVQSETGRKIIVADPSKHKVFNYMMQLAETEEALARVYDVYMFLRPRQSKVVLYTYDAILLDVHNDELSYMGTVGRLLSAGGYPVREYRGHNYNNLILHKI
jgi:hypothetical protein